MPLSEDTPTLANGIQQLSIDETPLSVKKIEPKRGEQEFSSLRQLLHKNLRDIVECTLILIATVGIGHHIVDSRQQKNIAPLTTEVSRADAQLIVLQRMRKSGAYDTDTLFEIRKTLQSLEKQIAATKDPALQKLLDEAMQKLQEFDTFFPKE